MPAKKLVLDRYLPAIINSLSNRLVTTGTDTLSALDVGHMDVRVMTLVSAEPNISASRIVEAVALNKGAVSRVLKSLVDRGLMDCAAPFDPRRPVYALTKLGRQVTRATDVLGMQRHDILVEGLSPDQVETLISLLQVLVGNTAKLKAFAAEQKRAGRGRAVSP